MAPIDQQVDPPAGRAFELERFEWTAADRLEVSGRWFGVRGRRFVRPTLHLRVDGRRRRLIALLDHKPWAAATDALWTAAFTWRGDHSGVTATRLEVSPDVILDLPAPGGEAPAEPLVPRPRPKAAPRKPRTPELPPAAAGAQPDALSPSEPSAPDAEASSLPRAE